jgi:hypothetical protein
VSCTCSLTMRPWPDAGRRLSAPGMGIADAREVFVIDVEDRPAALGELTRRLAEANVNVDLAYTTFTGGKIVIATDDAGRARSVLRA